MTSIYVSQGDTSIYDDEAITEGVGAPSRRVLSFGCFFFDYDLDGRLDLLETNGHLEENIDEVDPSQSYAQAPQLFWNAGLEAPQTYTWIEDDSAGDLLNPVAGRASAYGDFDADGDLDVVVTQVAGPPLLLRNDQALGRHWLRVKLQDAGPNRDAIGATVELESGGVTQRRLVMPARSYLASVELPLSFGLGENAIVDRLTVTWPDGSSQDVPVDAVDKMIVIDRE